jgi:hypothetical protein
MQQKSPKAYAARLTTSVGNVKIGCWIVAMAIFLFALVALGRLREAQDQYVQLLRLPDPPRKPLARTSVSSKVISSEL